jgi:hypothetical protein
MTRSVEVLECLVILNTSLSAILKSPSSMVHVNPKQVVYCAVEMEEEEDGSVIVQYIWMRFTNNTRLEFRVKPETTKAQAEEVCKLVQLLGSL